MIKPAYPAETHRVSIFSNLLPMKRYTPATTSPNPQLIRLAIEAVTIMSASACPGFSASTSQTSYAPAGLRQRETSEHAHLQRKLRATTGRRTQAPSKAKMSEVTK